MLNPDTRHLLTDVLRPPTGWRLDTAVATTYTLDLTTLLLAPLSLAAYDHAEEGIDKAAPHELLEAVRRYADRTTVFCQAGGIHVPSTYRKLIVFAEGSIVEVAPPPGRTFHPKIWVLRFCNAAGDQLHRFACLSRNLTGDRSWDTVLVLDEATTDGATMPSAPVADFLQDLLATSVRPVSEERRDIILDLARTVAVARLRIPEPFTGGSLYPLGTASSESTWPMPSETDRAVVISPFLDLTTIRRLPRGSTIVSRPEAFDRLGSAVLEAHDLRVLQPHADAPPESVEDGGYTSSALGEAPALEVKSGLHAKVLAWDVDGAGNLLTGSANATSAAFGGNIEFGVLLSGPSARCGAAAVLRDDDKHPGFARLLQPYMASTEPSADVEYELEREIETFHVALAAAGPELHVHTHAGGYEVSLHWQHPVENGVGQSWVRPITLQTSLDRRLDELAMWPGLGMSDLTTFASVRTRLERDGVVVERATALQAYLVGAPEDRARRVLRELLSKIEDVLRYLSLLLKDPGLDDVAGALLEASSEGAEAGSWKGSSWVDDLVLVEPLVRAFARDDGSLDRVERLLEDLRDDDGNLPDLGESFDELWRVVSAARNEAR